jgi:hypothetical protein
MKLAAQIHRRREMATFYEQASKWSICIDGTDRQTTDGWIGTGLTEINMTDEVLSVTWDLN